MVFNEMIAKVGAYGVCANNDGTFYGVDPNRQRSFEIPGSRFESIAEVVTFLKGYEQALKNAHESIPIKETIERYLEAVD